MEVVTVENLTKTYRIPSREMTIFGAWKGWFGVKQFVPYTALKNISFSVERGESFGIIGANGAGKSTLLSCLVGITAPTSGSYQVKGRVVAILDLHAGGHPLMTGREYLRLSGCLLGMSGEEIAEKEAKVIEYADIGDYIDRQLRTYSSGMIIRLGFAVAINSSPDVIVADEVLAVGDSAFQKKCWNSINELKKSGVTIVLVSHNLEMIRETCNRGIVLSAGEIINQGSANEIVDWYLDKSGIENTHSR